MKEITNKDDVCQAIAAVMRTLDTGITVTGVQNACLLYTSPSPRDM